MFSIPFNLSRKIKIEKSAEQVFKTLNDFKTWKEWSPWLCQEPTCKVTIGGEAGKPGHQQEWDGKRIGSGKMTLKASTPSKKLDYDLHFLKPWKSFSKVSFELSANENETTVTWTMNGTLPIFIFFLKKMMAALVGNDYERGLSMLKDYLEKGEVHTVVDVQGVKDNQGFYFIGKRNQCTTDDLGSSMEKDFGAMANLLDSGQLQKPDFVFSVYHNFDLVRRKCDYTSGFAYRTNQPAAEIDGMTKGEYEPHKALRVDHTGPYRNLGNAWSAAMGTQRAEKYRPSKTIPMYEIYSNDPGAVPEKDIRTEIYLPLK